MSELTKIWDFLGQVGWACCGHLVGSWRALRHLSREWRAPLCRPGSFHVQALLSDVISDFFSWLLLGGLACRPFFRQLPSVPHILCFHGWTFSARHHGLVATATHSFEDVLVSAGAARAVPADTAVLDSRKDSTLP